MLAVLAYLAIVFCLWVSVEERNERRRFLEDLQRELGRGDPPGRRHRSGLRIVDGGRR